MSLSAATPAAVAVGVVVSSSTALVAAECCFRKVDLHFGRVLVVEVEDVAVELVHAGGRVLGGLELGKAQHHHRVGVPRGPLLHNYIHESHSCVFSIMMKKNKHLK